MFWDEKLRSDVDASSLREESGCEKGEKVTTASDEQLVRCFVATEEERHFEQLVLRHTPRIQALIRQMLGPGNPDVDDATQEIFLRYRLVQLASTLSC